jgi:hypothetical protein
MSNSNLQDCQAEPVEAGVDECSLIIFRPAQDDTEINSCNS